MGVLSHKFKKLSNDSFSTTLRNSKVVVFANGENVRSVKLTGDYMEVTQSLDEHERKHLKGLVEAFIFSN